MEKIWFSFSAKENHASKCVSLFDWASRKLRAMFKVQKQQLLSFATKCFLKAISPFCSYFIGFTFPFISYFKYFLERDECLKNKFKLNCFRIKVESLSANQTSNPSSIRLREKKNVEKDFIIKGRYLLGELLENTWLFYHDKLFHICWVICLNEVLYIFALTLSTGCGTKDPEQA